ncbi:cell division protein FtsZ [Blattabacterium punctulatus]|uniref:Cell division protein FtsZ n=1 Tax=Blattabacterium punctulatus TaxID=164514 RepID=A0ABM6WN54_9FLAO|nr:cell division protein FtsZ [Blattabacterium punctulatus]AWU39894.1 cell division protein FtsZ [Blattabacterium punctulatus]AWU40439.1 cell division protein FtsZ [Blattabacterium punctulatus]AWU42692.1 cell division protein FtsZ [Blattabacterium punctulatus]AWU43239.1 cell division protein FtsZ [Blattabacterium punctulatus]AWU45977.1 cell division protein FtsZ [Blattabacterium punctulatus]
MKKENFIQKKENVPFGFSKNRSASIKVIGVGGGGSNALSYMFEQGITGVDFIACNTDAQALNNNPVPLKIQLGASITEGLGAGADPEVGEKAALESLEEIKSILDSNTKMTFITAGMGGGTGTGAAPIIAGISKEKGILTVGIVTIPFHFEGKMRLQQAQKGIETLRKNVDSLIVINNDKLRELYGNLGFKAGFSKADEVLTTAAKGIAEVITHHYKQNIDLRDTRTVLKESGTAVMGSSISVGENRAKEAVVQALDSPLLNDNKITGAKNVLLLIVSGKIEITIDEIGIISDYIQAEAGNNANIIMGIGEDENLEESISVTIVATGFPTEVQRVINHEEKKIFHRLEEPYKQRLTKIEEIPSYFNSKRIESIASKKKDIYNNKMDSSINYNKGKFSLNLNQKKNIINHPSSSLVEKKYKRYMLEDNFNIPISYEEKNKILKNNQMKLTNKIIIKKENNKHE